MSLVKDTSSGTATATTTATTTGSETPPSIAARDSPQATTASIASSTTKPSSSTTSNAMINDNDHPPDRTLWLGDLEPWMDDHYMVQVCSLFGWDTSAIHIPRPPAAPNATRHPNNAGYCLLVFSSHEKASGVMDVYGPSASSANANNANAQPVLLPNSNRAIKLDWLSSASARSAIGRDPTPVDSAIEYSIFVGDIAADVTNADLMNVFRNPNLGLRGDFPPRLIAPFLSCCNAKVMVDSVTGISKGYGFVRFTSEADQKRALLEMQGLYCKSRPMRLSTATAKNKNPAADEEHVEAHNTNNIPVVVRVTPSTLSPTGSQPSGPVSPKSIDPARIRSITSAVAESAAPTSAPSSASSTSQRVTGEHQAGMFAKIAQLSNTLGQHYPAYRGGPVLPPPGMSNAQIQQWLIANPHAKSQLETILGGSIGPLTGDLNGAGAPVEHKPNVPPSDPLNTTVFVGGLSPLISEETLRTFFAPFGAIHYVKVPPGKSCGFVQYVRKSDAERAIEALGGFSIGGSKVRLSWGRIPAAQGAAQAAAAAAAAASANNVHASRTIAPPLSNPGDGPLSSEQAAAIIEKLVPALMAAAHHNHNGASGPISPSSNNNNTGLPLGMRSLVNQQQILPPRASAAPQGFRDAYGYPSPGPLTGQSPGPGYMHSNVNANPYGPAHGHPHAHAHAHGPHPNRLDYARNDYYYDPVPSSAGYSPAYSYMNVNMGGQGQGGAGAYGGGSASVLEDQLIGTYGGGIHRLQSSSLCQGPSPGNYGAGSAGGYMGGGGLGAVGGYGGSEYDLDLGGFRSAGSFSGPPSAGIGATSGGGLYGGGGAFGGGMYGGGAGDMGGMSDRFGSRAGPFGSSSASGMNGFGPVGGGGPGLNGFGSAGHGGHGHSHGGHGHGGSSPYDYTSDASPQFQATDILRQDSTGLSYLSNNTSPGSAASGAHGKSAGTGTTPSKVNGHGHGAPGSRINDDGGMRDLASRFGSLGVGSGAGTGAGGAGSSATSGTNSGVGSKGPLSPTGSSGVSGGFASQQHFRGDSGRYN